MAGITRSKVIGYSGLFWVLWAEKEWYIWDLIPISFVPNGSKWCFRYVYTSKHISNLVLLEFGWTIVSALFERYPWMEWRHGIFWTRDPLWNWMSRLCHVRDLLLINANLYFFVAVWITIIKPLNHLGFSGHVDFCIVTAPSAILKVRDCGNGCFRVKKKLDL